MSKYIIRIILVVLLAFSLEAKAGKGMIFPGKDWEEATPESQGMDSTKLNAAVSYLKNNSRTSREQTKLIGIMFGRYKAMAA